MNTQKILKQTKHTLETLNRYHYPLIKLHATSDAKFKRKIMTCNEEVLVLLKNHDTFDSQITIGTVDFKDSIGMAIWNSKQVNAEQESRTLNQNLSFASNNFYNELVNHFNLDKSVDNYLGVVVVENAYRLFKFSPAEMDKGTEVFISKQIEDFKDAVTETANLV